MQAKYDLFLILMRNRQLPLSVDYVGYLHVVQAIYAKNKAVLDAYDHLMKHINTAIQSENWGNIKNELFAKMLCQMSLVLNIKVDQIDLMQKIYYPTGWGENQKKVDAVQEYQYKIATGKAVPQIMIVQPPQDSGA